jgi:hypothetical protein
LAGRSWPYVSKPAPRLSGRNWRGNMQIALRFSRKFLCAELRTARISKRGTAGSDWHVFSRVLPGSQNGGGHKAFWLACRYSPKVLPRKWSMWTNRGAAPFRAGRAADQLLGSFGMSFRACAIPNRSLIERLTPFAATARAFPSSPRRFRPSASSPSFA